MHPTVSGMTRSLLSVRSVDFLGDPLQDLELVPFLDKFQGKEAKSHAEGSVFRPMGGVTGSVTMARVGSKSFGELEEEAVGVVRKDPTPNLFFEICLLPWEKFQSKVALLMLIRVFHLVQHSNCEFEACTI